MKVIHKNLEELENMLNEYKALKVKFISQKDKFDEKEKAVFEKNYDNKIISILISLIYVLYKENKLSVQTNPFIKYLNEKETKRYSSLFCLELSNFNTEKIATNFKLLTSFQVLKEMIKKMKTKYIYNIDFWKCFIRFYMEYNE